MFEKTPVGVGGQGASSPLKLGPWIPGRARDDSLETPEPGSESGAGLIRGRDDKACQGGQRAKSGVAASPSVFVINYEDLIRRF